MEQFKSGAKSNEVKPRFDLIPLEALQYMAERFGGGAVSHGERNWEQGANDPEYILDVKNHTAEHLLNYIAGRTTVDKNGREEGPIDHLKAALTRAAMLAYFEEHRPADLVPEKVEDTRPDEPRTLLQRLLTRNAA